MVTGSRIRGHLLATPSVFVFILLFLALQIGATQEAPQQYDGSNHLQEQLLNTGALVRSVRRVAVIGTWVSA